MRAPLRIAAHNGARAWGGGEKWTVLLLAGLQERGHRVHLFCNHAEVARRAREAGVESSVEPLGGHLMLPHVWSFARALRRERPDALLLSTFKKVWLGGMAGRRAGVPVIVSRVGLDTDLPGKHWSYRLAWRRWVDATLVNADGIRRAIVAGLPGVPPSRVATVYDGIRLGRTLPGRAEARAALGLPTGVPIVGSVTRLSAQKRLDRFLEALARLEGVHGLLAGEGELEEELRARARALGLEGRLHLVGFRSDVETVLAALDVFVLTSDREGMANAMLEAMAAGLPVVSTPVSGADEALAPDAQGRVAGRIVAFDAGAVAGAVADLLAHPDEAARLGREGARRARERFSYEAMLDAWEAVLAGDDPALWHQGR